jgi:PAS domain S-box-containing protein
MLRWLNELSTQGIFTTDCALIVRSWNAWLVRATGRSEEDVIGRPLLALFPEIGERHLDRYYEAALKGEVSVLAHRFHNHLLRIPTALGHMPQSSRVAPLLDGGGIIGTISVIEDVTERVSSEVELRRQIAAAEQARAAAEDALRVKDEFLATLSHELRTPLNAVLGWTNILLGQKIDLGEKVDEEMLIRALRVIDRNAVAQARLIDDMLDMARIVTGKLRLEMGPVDLVAATLAAIDAIAPSALAKNISIHRNVGARARLIIADADRVQQIAWNVLSNAIKFTPKGGSIAVRIEDDASSTRLVITDTGKGISADFLPHVFERFRQANSSVSRTEGGLGLGLALVRQLVEMHGGHVDVSSPGVGGGATFTVAFPSLDEETALRRPATEAAGSEALTACRVLVVDDEADWRELLAQVLQTHGAHVLTAGSAEEALEILSGGGEGADVLVADVGLPGEDGYALIRRVRELPGVHATLPALAITAYAGHAHREQALAAGFDMYCAKPITPAAVTAAVAEVLNLFASRASRRNR